MGQGEFVKLFSAWLMAKRYIFDTSTRSVEFLTVGGMRYASNLE